MMFNMKCKFLHLRRKISMHQYILEVNLMENSFEEKDLRILVETKFNMSQQCTFVSKINCILGFIR